MRPSACRRSIITAVSGVTPDARRRRADVFTHVEVAPDPEGGTFPERTFKVLLSSPPATVATYASEDLKEIEYLLEFHYSSTAELEDRLADDASLIEAALEGLERIEADIQVVVVVPRGIGVVSGLVTLMYTVRITYRHTFT